MKICKPQLPLNLPHTICGIHEYWGLQTRKISARILDRISMGLQTTGLRNLIKHMLPSTQALCARAQRKQGCLLLCCPLCGLEREHRGSRAHGSSQADWRTGPGPMPQVKRWADKVNVAWHDDTGVFTGGKWWKNLLGPGYKGIHRKPIIRCSSDLLETAKR